jgi:hypothetical protein
MGNHDEQIDDLRRDARSLDDAFEDFTAGQRRFLAGALEGMRWYWRGDREMSLQLEVLADDMRQDARFAEHAYNGRREDISQDIKRLKRADAEARAGSGGRRG